jgi:hypothetical protein
MYVIGPRPLIQVGFTQNVGFSQNNCSYGGHAGCQKISNAWKPVLHVIGRPDVRTYSNRRGTIIDCIVSLVHGLPNARINNKTFFWDFLRISPWSREQELDN